MHGDRVRIEVRSDGQGRYIGALLEVLERGVQAFLGTIEAAQRGLAVRAADQRLGLQCVVVDNPVQARAGDWVIARVLRTRKTGRRARRASSSAWIPSGRCRWPRRRRSRASACRWTSPAAALREAAQWGKSVDPAEAAQRTDLRALPLVTIDGADAKDFDDAVYAERLEGGGFGCWSRLPTSATTCAPAARSIPRRARAAPRCISRRACCRCCRPRCRITCARSSRMWTGCAWWPTCVSPSAAHSRTAVLSGGDALGGAADLPRRTRRCSSARRRRAQRWAGLDSLLPLVDIYHALQGCAAQARRPRVRRTGSRIRDRERRAGARHRIQVAQRCPQADRGMHGAGQCRGGAGAAHTAPAGAVSRARLAG
jgi:hypothetical protein